MKQTTVRRLQERLRVIAHAGNRMPEVTVDGVFDEPTQNALRAFQQLCGLPVTGEPDYDTCRRIDGIYALVEEGLGAPVPLMPFPDGNVSLKPGDRSPAVALVEVMLNALAGRYGNLPSVPVNGLYDPPTEEAVRQLQACLGLEPDGRVDKRTWNGMARLFQAAGQER